MPFWFVPGITQAMHWTLLSPYLVECPAENPRIEWPIYPGLTIQVCILSLGVDLDCYSNPLLPCRTTPT
jgi:hypothetical protein